MNDLYDLCFHVENELTGVPQEVVKFTLRGVLRDFCRKTFSWRQKTYSRICREVMVYDAAGLADAEVLAVLSVLIRKAGQEKQEFENITRSGFYKAERNSLFFRPGYLDRYDGGELVIETALTPMFDSANVPPGYLSRYSSAIISGTISELAKQKKRPWFDAETYQIHSEKYRTLVNEAIPIPKHFRG